MRATRTVPTAPPRPHRLRRLAAAASIAAPCLTAAIAAPIAFTARAASADSQWQWDPDSTFAAYWQGTRYLQYSFGTQAIGTGLNFKGANVALMMPLNKGWRGSVKVRAWTTGHLHEQKVVVKAMPRIGDNQYHAFVALDWKLPEKGAWCVSTIGEDAGYANWGPECGTIG